MLIYFEEDFIYESFDCLGKELFFDSFGNDDDGWIFFYLSGEYFSNLYLINSGSYFCNFSTFFWIFKFTLPITKGLCA